MNFNLKTYAYIVSALCISFLIATLIISITFMGAIQQQRELSREFRAQNKQLIAENLELLNKKLELEKKINQGLPMDVNSQGAVYVTNNLNTPRRVAYLTFDDGPSASTPRILDILKQHNAKATFFVVGNETQAGKNAYKRIVEEGHALGNHTFSHDYLRLYNSKDIFLEDFDRLQQHLLEITGVEPIIYRLPGSTNSIALQQMHGSRIVQDIKAELSQRGLTSIGWNVDSFDAINNRVTKEDVLNTVLAQAAEKDQIIVLMHDSASKRAAVDALPELLTSLREMGFVFHPITQDTIATAGGIFDTH